MDHRAARALRFVVIVLSIVGLAWLSPTAAPAGLRHAGTVLMLDASTGTLTLDEYWVGGQRRALKVRTTTDTQFVLSERNDMFTDLTDTFTTTPIRARDLRVGDFVVVELVDTAPDNLASLVMVTHAAAAGS
jgi:hypothetical protein